MNYGRIRRVDNKLQVEWTTFVLLARHSGLKSKKNRAIKKRGKKMLMVALRNYLEMEHEPRH